MRLEIAERQLLQVREEIVPEVVLDVARHADDDAAHEKPEQRRRRSATARIAAAYVISFCRVTARLRSSIGVLQDPRRKQLEGGRERRRTPTRAGAGAGSGERKGEGVEPRAPSDCEYSSDICDRASTSRAHWPCAILWEPIPAGCLTPPKRGRVFPLTIRGEKIHAHTCRSDMVVVCCLRR